MKPREMPGAKLIGPGIYAIGEEMHVDAEEICDHFKVPASERNMETTARVVRDICAERGIEYAEGRE